MEGDWGRGRSTPRTWTRAQRASRTRDSDREDPEPASERSGRSRPQQLEGEAVGGRATYRPDFRLGNLLFASLTINSTKHNLVRELRFWATGAHRALNGSSHACK
eukprot:SAG31_NODE_3081_length_4701_cov_2.801608_3_plen_105_part_00